jgi:hypothetical protein
LNHNDLESCSLSRNEYGRFTLQFDSKHGKWQSARFPTGPTVKNHFRDAGLYESRDPAEYNSASYWPDPLENIEPLPDNSNPYRYAALNHLRVLDAIDQFVAASTDA